MSADFAPKQIGHGTGSPPTAENICTEEFLRTALGDMTILHLRSYDAVIHEGSRHDGIPAPIDLVAARLAP